MVKKIPLANAWRSAGTEAEAEAEAGAGAEAEAGAEAGAELKAKHAAVVSTECGESPPARS